MKPVVAIYSTFLQRAYDQLVHDVALQDLNVLFAIDRGGVVGPDGPTHSGSFDLSYLRCIPNMVVMAPADENECRLMLSTGFRHEGPAAVRYPRGTGPGTAVSTTLDTLPIGKAEVRRHGAGLALLAFGAGGVTKLGEKIGGRGDRHQFGAILRGNQGLGIRAVAPKQTQTLGRVKRCISQDVSRGGRRVQHGNIRVEVDMSQMLPRRLERVHLRDAGLR